MKTKNILYFLLAYFWILTTPELLSNSIEIRDTTIFRSRLDTIPIYGTVDSPNPSRVKVLIKFNAYLLDIKKIIGGTETIFQEPEPSFTIQLNNLDDATIEIISNNIQPVATSILCKMVVEGLVYRDSICVVTPLSLWVNDTLVESELISDTIKVVGPPIFQAFKNFLDNPFPLPPVGDFVRFNFGVANVGKPSDNPQIKVEFYVFNSAGAEVFNSKGDIEVFSAIAVGSNTTVDLNKNIEPGVYRLLLTLPNDFAAGVYYLQMRTSENIVLNTKFLFVK